ncbi:conserved hypothetical protein [Pyrobaculum islandicum DSM 4184]|uniref:Pyrimidine dimer DNA glycosylase n=1 Tax=Pyrobaculum islandicum (strain DSM 4184 / JCM 9189 / GEO3) TaxID=384616 RepID=A1RR55_PYRIL|nr:pyrimidine dimer DNA glycosylase/endonuclease V [Pyrobaculum islandicum]ABL87437.1 conserved hypothetical protein [Pyrobaculum islandicum DSM 4184]
MQIFRPYRDHARSAAFLDDRRLGKQRAEAKQVILAILRRRGSTRREESWLNHPIVLMYDAGPYINDLVAYFHAAVEEWRRRGRRNSVSLADVQHLIAQLPSAPGTPITHTHEVEYRRILLLKDPCHYLGKMTEEELAEVLETEPTPIPGVNTWIFQIWGRYREFVEALKRGQVDCRGIFPRRGR